ncbi:hypothetical protein D3C81_1581970 [compost metagenome]
MRGVVLVGADEVVGHALFTGKGRRRGVVADVETVLGGGVDHGRQHVGKNHPGVQRDTVQAHAVGDLLGLGRLQAVIFHDESHRHAAELAAFLIDRQLEAVSRVFAQITGGGGEGGDEADSDWLHGLGSRRCAEGGCQTCTQYQVFHEAAYEVGRANAR